MKAPARRIKKRKRLSKAEALAAWRKTLNLSGWHALLIAARQREQAGAKD